MVMDKLTDRQTQASLLDVNIYQMTRSAQKAPRVPRLLVQVGLTLYTIAVEALYEKDFTQNHVCAR